MVFNTYVLLIKTSEKRLFLVINNITTNLFEVEHW